MSIRSDEKMTRFWQQIPLYNGHDFRVYNNFSLEMLETFGVLNPGLSFEYMARYQHGVHAQELLNDVYKVAGQQYQLRLMQRLRNHVRINNRTEKKKVEEDLKLGQPFFDRLSIAIDYAELFKKLPLNSAYIILQFSPN